MSELRDKIDNPALTPMDRLVLLFQILRSPEGCAWDRKQTHQSLVPYLIEESYEAIEAIERGDQAELCEELGDVLTQVVFHTQLASERGDFTLDQVAQGVVNKLVNRHPHVFGEQKDLDPKQVRDQWERIKTNSGEKESVLGGLPKTMPALTMAFRMGEKAGGVGFDWQTPQQVLDKIREEFGEVTQEMSTTPMDKSRLEDEIGDLLFATASLARKLDIEPEIALRNSLTKFRNRFDILESRVKESGKRLEDLTLEQLEAIWQDVKSA
ncbi:MAG: nucleoside triphosphate pyrophosphohydrolase [Candidatus Zixiibacteriota bacterium]